MAIRKVYSEDNHCDMYEADYRVKLPNGKQKRIRKLYFTKQAAKNAMMRDKVAAERGEFASASKITLKEWAERVNKYVRSHRKGTTIQSYKTCLAIFNQVIGEGRRLESLDRGDLRRFIEYLKDEKKNDSTIKLYFSKIKAAMNLAPQLFEELTAWHPPTFKFENYSKSRDRVLEPVEIAALLSHLSPDVQDIVLFALNTGGRLREVLSLTWDRVLWDAPGYAHGALKLKVTKVRGVKESVRIVPATAEVRAILERRKQTAKSQFVFPSPGNPKAPRTGLEKSLSTACGAAGIVYGRDVPGGFVFHDLRRTAVTYLRRAGIDIETVCSITGHSPTVMLHTYSKTNVASQQKAVDALANILPFGQLKESHDSDSDSRRPLTSTTTDITKTA